MTEAVATATTATPAAEPAAQVPGEQQQATEPVKFDDWYGKLDDQIKDLVDDHVSGLKSALAAKSEELTHLSANFKALRKSLDNNDPDEAKRQMDQITAERDEFARRAQFAEQAPNEGVSNAKVAWIVAKESELVDKAGNVDFLALREIAPELFKSKTPVPAGNAGNGAGQSGVVKPDMNRFLRAAAGRS